MTYKELGIRSFMTSGSIPDEVNYTSILDVEKLFRDNSYTYHINPESTDCRDTLISRYFGTINCYPYQFFNRYGYLKCKNYLSIRYCNADTKYIETAKAICRLPSLVVDSNSYSYTVFVFNEFPFPAKVSLFSFFMARCNTLKDLTDHLSNNIIRNKDILFNRESGQYNIAFWTAFACQYGNLLNDGNLIYQQFYFGGNLAYVFEQAFHKNPLYYKNFVRDFIRSNGIEIPEDAQSMYDPHYSLKSYLNYFLGGNI